jgi:hypothetical protein
MNEPHSRVARLFFDHEGVHEFGINVYDGRHDINGGENGAQCLGEMGFKGVLERHKCALDGKKSLAVGGLVKKEGITWREAGAAIICRAKTIITSKDAEACSFYCTQVDVHNYSRFFR